ncbi:OLC1v1033864C2 [Oldenlandia corymbosa var. corymbosa]|nr:OLC1v1033864C2 [Oldenlandia corymbosa var. corymbosa]
MEDMLKKQQSCGTTTATLSSLSGGAPLGMHKNSQIIAKPKPKIRIIHIFAPEIIKTDVANFRELVQRLTGKPTPQEMTKSKNNSSMNTKKKRPRNTDQQYCSSSSRSTSSNNSSFSATNANTNINNNNSFSHHPAMIHKPFATKLELRSGFLKGEEDIWRNANSGGGYLGGFAELEGFMEQLHHEFPLLPSIPMESAAAPPPPPTLLNY